MSATIDEKIVSMRFDNSNFENNVKTSMSTLEKLKKALKFDGASKGLDDIQNASKRVNLSPMASAADTVTQKFSYMQMTIQHQLNRIVDSAVNTGKRMISALTIDPIKTGLQEYETQINAVQTILANTQHNGTTLDEVNTALDTLNTYADKTIYNFTEMTRNIGTFTAAGVDLQTSVDSIQGIANLAAVSGSTSQQASTAMYQLSQALAAGKVSLMDWNSVVNAGMGGKVFQDALVRTSELLGTGAEQAIKTAGSFRESLTKSGWLTTEVLTETLSQLAGAYSEADLIAKGFTKEQAKEISNLAETAVNAATKVKTFSQLWDTLKEAAQSGWTQTWELIIGDFDEAKELLTGISDKVGDMINKMSESRNNLLGGALKSPWKKFIEELGDAGVSADKFQTKVRELYDAANGEGAFDEVVSKSGSFEKACRSGAISTGMLKDALGELSGKLIDLSGIQAGMKLGDTGEEVKKVQEALKNLNYDLGEFGADGNFGKYTESALKAFQEANNLEVTGVVDEATLEALDKATAKTNDLSKAFSILDEGLNKLGGREKIIESFKNIFGALGQIIGPIKQAFKEVFPPATSEQLANAIDKFHSFTESLKLSGKTVGQIRLTFKGLFSVIAIGVDALKAVGSGFVKVLSSLMGFNIGFLNGTSSIGEFLTNLRETIKENDIFGKTVDAVVNILTGGVDAVKNFGNSLKESLKLPSAGGFLGFFTSIWNGISKLSSFIITSLSSVGSYISEAFGKGDIFEVLNSGLIAGIFLGIKKFTNTLDDTLGGAGSFLENVTGILDDVRGCFKAYQEQLKAGSLMKIAIAIGILAASLYVISTIPSDKLEQSLFAIGALGVGLIGFLKVLDMMSLKIKGSIKAIGLMIGLSVAILILGSAMKVISSLSWEEIGKGLAGVGALMFELSLFMKYTKFEGKMISTALGIVLLASAMVILSHAVKNFGNMKWEEIGKGLAAVGGLLLEISLFTKLTGNAKKLFSTGAAMVLLGASMKIFASAMKDFGSMNWEEIGKGLAAMGGALLEVGIAMRLMPKGSIFKSAGLLIAAASLKILANVFTDFSGMSWGGIGKGLVAMGGALAELAIGLNLMRGTVAGSASLLIAAVALRVFTPVMVTLGNLSWGEIGKGLVALAGAFVIIGVAGLLLSPIVPAILALGAAILLLGVGVAAIGGGLVLAAAGITALVAAVAGGATAIVAALEAIIIGLYNLAPELAKAIGRTILEVAVIAGEYAPQLADSLCKMLVEAAKSLATYTPQLVSSLLELLIGVINSLAEHVPELIVAFVNLFGKVFEGIVKALNQADTTNLLKGIAAVGLMSLLAYVLAGLIAVIPGAMIGLLGIGLLIAEMALIFAAIGGLAQIPGLKWLMSEGADFIAEIGHALGYAIGSFISGIGEGVTSGLAQIGQNIADFMAKLAIASDNASGIKTGSFDGVAELLNTLATVGLTTVGTTISDIFTLGGTSMEKFQTDGVAFFNAMKAISEASAGVTVNEESMGAVIGIATKLADLQSSLEPIGGVISWFTGRDDLGTFGINAGLFVVSMKKAFSSLDGVTFNTEAVSAIIACSSELATLQSSLEPIGGVISWFTGRDDLATFGVNIGLFIRSMTNALGSLGDTTFNEEALTTIISSATELSELQSSLEPIGGVISWFTGRDDLGTFGINIGQFINSMSTALSSLGNVTFNEEALTTIISAATKLANLQSSLESIGGVVDWFTGRDDLGTFGTNVASFIGSMSTALGSLGDVTFNEEALTSIISAATKLADLQSSLENIGGVVDWFTGRDDLGTFGTNVASFIGSMSTAMISLGDTTFNEEALTSVITAATKLSELQSSLEPMGGVIDWFTGQDDLGTFGENIATFAEAMGKLKEGMGETGITEDVVASITNAGNALIALNNALPSEGFFDSKITMTDFSNYINDFSAAISDFSSKASEIDSGAINTAITAANRIKTLIASISDLDTSGVATFTGVGVGGMGADGVAYNIAEAIAAFSEKVADIDTGVVSKSITAANRLKTFISSLSGLDNSGIENFKVGSIGTVLKKYSDQVSGLKTEVVSKSITAATRLKTFISSLTGLDSSGISNFKVGSIGTTLSSYANSVSSVDYGKIVSSIAAASKIKSFISSLDGMDASGVSTFKSAVSSLAKTNISGMTKAFSDSTSKFSSAGSNITNALAKGLTSKSGVTTSAVTSIMTKMLSSITSKTNAFRSAGSRLMSGMVSGIRSQSSKVSSAVTSGMSGAASAVRGYYNSFFNAGSYAGSGLVSGMRSQINAAANAAAQMAQAAVNSAKEKLQINSPSKVFRAIGSGIPEGFAMGIAMFGSAVNQSVNDMAEGAIDSTSSAIASIYDMMNSEIDSQPTIRPVLDLADVEAGANAIGGMFSGGLPIGTSMQLGSISAMMSQRNQNGTVSDIVDAIDDLRTILGNVGNTSYNINGVTYDKGTDVADAIETLARAAVMGRRV